VVASLGALGVDIDIPKCAMLRRELADALDALGAATSRSTVLDATLATLRSNLAIERVLSLRLTVDQRERYRAHTGDTPFFDQEVPRVALAGRSPEGLGEQLASHWVRLFELSGSSALSAARAIAGRHARDAVKVASTSTPAVSVSRRGGLLYRAVCLLEVQRRAEEDLAAHPALTAAERARVEAGIGSSVIEVECVS